MNNYRLFALSLILSIIATAFSCSPRDGKTVAENYLPLSAIIAHSPPSEVQEVDYSSYAHLKVPPLAPAEALKKFKLEEGFRIEIVAHEPMVVDPIAMDIDADGRLWVIDMPSYMPVHDKGVLETSKLERMPRSRVVVLEDSDSDGRMDIFHVFFEGLTLPRAIKVLNDGILVAEPPNVWFIRDASGDGKGDVKELVYEGYGDNSDPNIHGYPGGLIWGMDNWLHSSNDNVESIRYVNNEWKTLPFRRLGQWGMSQDNWGRLYSSSNSRPLQTHLIPYGYSSRHPRFRLGAGKNVSIGSDTLWPAHPTGVNRGYREGVLRADGTLIKATAAASTVIYRGDQFGNDYVGNAFSPEPGANLIKRYIIDDDPAKIEAKARFAYEGREFLTSTDERFRPVNIYNAPDGSLYVVDMYRGILEHAAHLTEYLRDYAVEHDLHKPTGEFGRIYRIVRDDRKIDYNTPKFSRMDPAEWVDFLQHQNGQLRDQAQQVIVQASPPELIRPLEELVFNRSAEPYSRLHALWTLEGFDSSVYDRSVLTSTAIGALDDEHPRVRSSAIRILEPAITQNSKQVLERLTLLAKNETSEYVQLQLLASLGEASDNSALNLMAAILNDNMNSVYFREMALTGIYHREAQMENILRTTFGWSEKRGDEYKTLLSKLSEAVISENQIDLSLLTENQKMIFENGKQLFKTCGACHGSEGQGLDGIGPSLAGSQWVQSHPGVAIRIVLQGFSGGTVRGNSFAGVMPGHAYLSDKEVASVLTFIRQSWGNRAAPVTPDDVTKVREQTRSRSETWSPDELRQVLK